MKLDENKEYLVSKLRENLINFCTNIITCTFQLKVEGCIIVTSDEESFMIVKLDEILNKTQGSCPTNQFSNLTNTKSRLSYLNQPKPVKPSVKKPRFQNSGPRPRASYGSNSVSLPSRPRRAQKCM